MRGAWLALLLAVSVSGCFDFLGPEDGDAGVRPADVDDPPSSYRVSSVRVWPDPQDPQDDLKVASTDGAQLDVLVYEPITRDARPDGDPIRFPVLYLFHGWGWQKEYFENAPLGSPSEASPDPRVNLMEMFAQAGFITVAYDIRGFGQSEGTVGIVNAQDVQDFLAVAQYIDATFPNSGFTGVAGGSLGGGMSLRMMVDSGLVDAAASLFGWVDLYDALVPQDVPKAEWAALLYSLGQGGSRARLHNEVTQWMVDATQRTDLEGLEAALDTRSTFDRIGQSEVPLFLCQGLQESLFPQAHRAWETHGGFVRTHIYTGGHASEARVCWDRTLDWMDFFLRGVDNDVDGWPFLHTVDADGSVHPIGYSQDALDRVEPWMRFLHEESLVVAESQRTFTTRNHVLANPLQEPSGVVDRTGSSSVPEQFREDPGAVFFDSDAFSQTRVILGAPTLRLVPDNATRSQPFQVVATLYSVDAGGSSRLLTRGAYAHVAGEEDTPPAIEVPMDWTKATLPAGSRLVLKLGGNDPGFYMPMPLDQQPPGSAGERVFTGSSNLVVPLFEG